MLDRKLPDSRFTFTPPPGATEKKSRNKTQPFPDINHRLIHQKKAGLQNRSIRFCKPAFFFPIPKVGKEAGF